MSGVWMLVILVAFSGLVGLVAIPTLAAVLIIASFSAIRPSEITTVWSSGPSAQIALVTTFVSTLFLPVAAAVGIGVALSLLLSVNAAAQDVRVTEIMRNDRGEFEERDAPSRLEGRRVTILQVYGSLFYAGARTLEEELPVPDGADSPVVVIRIRGRVMMGATAFSVLSKYAASLDEHGGRLYLSGVAPELMQQFAESGRVTSSDPLKLKEATAVMGGSQQRQPTKRAERSWSVKPRKTKCRCHRGRPGFIEQHDGRRTCSRTRTMSSSAVARHRVPRPSYGFRLRDEEADRADSDAPSSA